MISWQLLQFQRHAFLEGLSRSSIAIEQRFVLTNRYFYEKNVAHNSVYAVIGRITQCICRG